MEAVNSVIYSNFPPFPRSAPLPLNGYCGEQGFCLQTNLPPELLRPEIPGFSHKQEFFFPPQNFLFPGPVSYTHLDVYKRQVTAVFTGKIL